MGTTGTIGTPHVLQTIGLVAIALAIGIALLAPVLAPQASSDQFADRSFAPPMRVHVRDADGFHAPFVYPQVLDSRLDRTFHDDRSVRVPIRWLRGGRLMSIDPDRGPLLLIGADALGRDVFSRVLYGARLSLGVTILGSIGALFAGMLIGVLAATIGGRVETVLMLFADFVLLLPGVYLVLVLRATLPQTMSTAQVFWLMVWLFAIAGWPHVARGVRAIVATERAMGYAEAARAAGAGALGVARHLVPATYGFLRVELTLLVPAMLVAEATISFLGLGFPEPAASWGTMLQEASNLSGMVSAPWTLAPAIALFVVVLSINLAGTNRWRENLLSSQD